MTQSVFYSDNDTGTFADTLKAIGLAEVLRAWLLHLGKAADRITIVNKGAYYQIELPAPLDEDAVACVHAPFRAGNAKRLAAEKRPKTSSGPGSEVRTHVEEPADGMLHSELAFDYDGERAKAAQYFERLKKLSDAERKRFSEHPEAFEDLRALTPHPDLGLYVYVNHFKIAEGYNALLDQWHGQDITAFHTNLRLVLTAFGAHPNPLSEAEEYWAAQARAGAVSGKTSVSRLQLINPASGKGGNSPKASRLGIGQLDGFWLPEYLKYVGLFTVAVPLTVQGAKDRKTFVLQPSRADLGTLGRIIADFRHRLYSTTAVKLDILAAVRFTLALLRYLEQALVDAQGNDPLLSLFGQAPHVTDIAAGFDMAFYKDMGSAFATMNLATINLPGWLEPVAAPEAAENAIALLTEHERVISGIRSAKGDEGSDEIELLRSYRDFLSGHDVARFFDFASRYGAYFLAKRHRNLWAEQLTTDGMERLMAQAQTRVAYSKILETPGFRAIATAIRQATVRAQYRAARESRYPYEVRYGLGQELLRAASYPDTFLAALSEFIQSYNAENARVDERIAKQSLPNDMRLRRAMVATDDIDQIVHLIDEFNDPELICKMLVAYGYARDTSSRGEPESEAPEGAMALPAERNNS